MVPVTRTDVHVVTVGYSIRSANKANCCRIHWRHYCKLLKVSCVQSNQLPAKTQEAKVFKVLHYANYCKGFIELALRVLIGNL